MIKGIVGCYQNNQCKTNVIKFGFDPIKNRFVKSEPFINCQDAKYVSIHDHFLVSLANNGKGGICLFDLNTKQMHCNFNQESTPCYIKQTDEFIYTANYHSGKVMVYQKDDSLRLIQCIDTGDKSGAHQILLYNQFLLVPCLLQDKLRIYSIDKDYELVTTIDFAPQTGPRHGIFIDEHLYLVTELSNQLFHFKLNAKGEFTLIEQMSLLTDELKGASAAIRLSTNNKFMYVSIRECNLIKVIDVDQFKIIQTLSVDGNHPRDIALSVDNRYMFVANRYSNQLHCFNVDCESGKIGDLLDTLKIVEGVSIDFFKETNDE